MSVQEPQDQFERDRMEDEIEESEGSLIESQLSDSDPYTLTDAESVDVPTPTGESDVSSSDDSDSADETEELDVPAIESMPVSGSDELPSPEPTEGPAWYVIHCYSGYENKVRHNLEQRIETMGMKDQIFDVVIPTQEEIEVKDGKRRTVERHIFPGYVLVNMQLTEESWYVVRNTPGVTGFVGMGNNPTPLRPEEVSQIVKRMEAEAPTVKVTFKVGERVRIIDGPFNDFRGVVSEIDMERTKVRVMVSFFGRETPVELDFLQVEKA
jgi:transcriptional antiterminator NusG